MMSTDARIGEAKNDNVLIGFELQLNAQPTIYFSSMQDSQSIV